MVHTSTLYNAVKTVVITGLCYGWFVPVGMVGSILQKAYPTSQLTEEWTIQSDGNLTGSLPWNSQDVEPILDDNIEQPIADDMPQSKYPTKTPATPEAPQPVPTPLPTDFTATSSIDKTTSGTTIQKPFSKIRVRTAPKNLKQHTGSSVKSKRNKCAAKASKDGITKLSGTEYQLNKKLIRKYRNNWKEAQKLARLSWYTQNGERKGIRIRGIGCHSPVRHSGLRPGDVVLAINNKPLTSEKDLLATYGRMMIWKDVELSILRNGRPLSIQYAIRK